VTRHLAIALALATLTWGSHASAQSAAIPPAGGDAAAAPAAPVEEERDDAVLNRAQPDFTLINLPTGLRLPKWKSAFRVTHRFTRPLGDGDFGDLASDFFGLDSGAIIGLEFRIGVAPGTQVGVHRTNDKTIQFLGQYDVKQQSESFPLGLAVYATIDGTDNFTDSYSPSLGLIVTREFGDHGALYLEPIWVNNTNALPSELVDDNNTMLLGIGGRVRLRPTLYFVGEVVPRLNGFDPGSTATSFAVEKRVGGHAFQLVFTNSFGLTMAQVARGGIQNEDGSDNWYLGFNISRKFF
jgi:uncharacterized beta barrel domain-containing protein DUF5777